MCVHVEALAVKSRKREERQRGCMHSFVPVLVLPLPLTFSALQNPQPSLISMVSPPSSLPSRLALLQLLSHGELERWILHTHTHAHTFFPSPGVGCGGCRGSRAGAGGIAHQEAACRSFAAAAATASMFSRCVCVGGG